MVSLVVAQWKNQYIQIQQTNFEKQMCSKHWLEADTYSRQVFCQWAPLWFYSLRLSFISAASRCLQKSLSCPVSLAWVVLLTVAGCRKSNGDLNTRELGRWVLRAFLSLGCKFSFDASALLHSQHHVMYLAWVSSAHWPLWGWKPLLPQSFLPVEAVPAAAFCSAGK